ncbi:LLM class flavin-dependent oxidoreductase [Branchiibius sp. NY16-3462-2]|uniref:LLM class flavin-dependent oxidoreductase n=1 Tax=Branchiibius sp. NY16-3462-2 TaxID=1807500 RepID=UPI0007969939|nr:LLM class flavin-dependent oxidoreductase [Branchiibius sp. NY16-3462-2]KYH43936.1 luciferase [Branchiibius sp. NY16-3462-2]
MKYGVVVPYATELEFVDAAVLAEQHGWDAVFGWEAVYGIDPWVQFAAAAMVTTRIRFGTLLTPASRHRPWDLASKVGSVDRISGGRTTLAVGLGALHDGWLAYEEDEGRSARARKLDEVLAVYAGLLTDAAAFSFSGEYLQARPNSFNLPPATPQRPHPPVWVVAAPTPGGGRQRSLERAARWQGAIPAIPHAEGEPKRVTAFADVVSDLRALRLDAGLPWEGYDVVLEADSWGSFTALEPADQQAWADAGATWWIESWWDLPEGPDGLQEVRRRIACGPPPA